MLSSSTSKTPTVLWLGGGGGQGSSRRSTGKYPVKPPRPEGDSQTIDTYHCRNNFIVLSIIDVFASVASGIRTCTAEVFS